MKKALSLLLVVLMLVGMLPMTVLNASAAAGDYELVTDVSKLSVGAKVIIAALDYDYALSTTQNGNNRAQAAITKGDGVLTSPSADVQVLTLEEGTTTGTYAFNTGSGYLYAASTSKNYLRTEATLSANSSWTITVATDGTATVTAQGANTRNVMQYNQSSGIFACYGSASQKAIVLYVLNEGTGDCDHADADVVTVDPTCTEAGSTTITCSCGYTTTSAIAALGHSWGEWSVVNAATCTESGSQTRACATCGTTENGDIVATGHNYADGKCSVCGTEAPAAVANKISTADEFVSGEYVMVVSSYAMGVYESGWVTAVQPVISDNSILDAVGGIWTLTVDGTSVKITDANGVVIAPKGGNNNGITEGDYSWGWSVNDDGTFSFAGVGDDTVKLASNTSSENKFRAYKAATVDGNTTGYLANFSLYKMVGSSSEGGEGGSEPEPEVTEPEVTEPSATPCPDENHTFVDGVCTKCGEAEPIGPIDPSDPTEGEVSTTTIDFSTTDQRVSLDTSSQVWANGDATVTNNKAGSTSNVVDYSNPVRFYKNSELIIALAGMTKIEIVCSSASYATTLAGCISDSTVTVTVEESTVTIVPTALIDSYTITLTGGQVRVSSITMTASTCEHVWGEWVETKEPNCTTAGVNTTTCSVCGNNKTESVPATGHSYDAEGNCTVCGITPAQVVEKAYALADGEALEGKYTLTGVINAVNELYSSDYQNVTVTMDVVGVTDMPIKCFQMKGEGVDQIGTGDTITVTGTLKNYGGTIEFDSGCTLDSWEDTGAEFVRPETAEDIVNAAYALAEDAILEGGTYTLTGVITNVGTVYSSKYSNITVTIQIGDMTDKPIVCYRLAGTGAELICVGDSVTVTGNLKNYNDTVEFDEGCTLDSYVINKGHTEEIDAAVEATCTTAGLTEGKRCSVCSLVIVAQEEVASHTIEHVAAVVPANCQETGHNEYWYCATCDIYYGDAEYSYQTNPDWLYYTGDHVRPEGAVVCAVVPCELCGEDSYGESCDRGDAPVCQDATCVNCGETVWGWGCNYNTGDEEVPLPLCQPGDCVYCGTHYDKIYDCENGAWAACLDGECAYGCGKQFPATEDHTVDPCVGGTCETCWTTFEGGHDYTGENGACVNCGEYQVDETLAFYNKGIVLSADIRGVLQIRKMKATSPYESFKVIAEKGGVETELELATTSDKTNHTTYSYTMTVPAKELSDVTNLRIIGITADGVCFTSINYTWSIKEGLISSMDTYSAQGTEDGALRTKLCANILHYGAEAQKHFTYNLDNLATDGLKEEYAALIITTTPEMVAIPKAEEPAGTYATLKEIGFNLAARVQILPRFTVPKADSKDSYSAVITKVHVAPDGTETTTTFTVEGDKILKGATSTSLYVYIDTLASKELRDVMTITLLKDGEPVSVIHTFSGESALYGKLSSLPALAAALMNYCDCARAVFG